MKATVVPETAFPVSSATVAITFEGTESGTSPLAIILGFAVRDMIAAPVSLNFTFCGVEMTVEFATELAVI